MPWPRLSGLFSRVGRSSSMISFPRSGRRARRSLLRVGRKLTGVLSSTRSFLPRMRRTLSVCPSSTATSPAFSRFSVRRQTRGFALRRLGGVALSRDSATGSWPRRPWPCSSRTAVGYPADDSYRPRVFIMKKNLNTIVVTNY